MSAISDDAPEGGLVIRSFIDEGNSNVRFLRVFKLDLIDGVTLFSDKDLDANAYTPVGPLIEVECPPTDHGILTGLSDDDHLQYLTEARHDSLIADNPHSVTATQVGAYTTTQTDTEISNAITTHEAATDPHPQYLQSSDLPTNHAVVDADNNFSDSQTISDPVGNSALEINTPSSNDSLMIFRNTGATEPLWAIGNHRSSGDLVISRSNGLSINVELRIDDTTIDAKTKRITDVVDPTQPQDAATKAYVDAQTSGVNSIDDLTDVDTTSTTPSVGDILQWNGTNWVPSKIKHNALAVGNIGSSSNSSNQNFQIDLSTHGFQVGDTVRLGNSYIRGDLSGNGSEYFDVGFGSTGDPKKRLGDSGYSDMNIFRTDGGLIDRTYTVTDIGGGTPGLQVYISPATAVNFSPTGMPNGWWWQFKVDILVA